MNQFLHLMRPRLEVDFFVGVPSSYVVQFTMNASMRKCPSLFKYVVEVLKAESRESSPRVGWVLIPSFLITAS